MLILKDQDQNDTVQEHPIDEDRHEMFTHARHELKIPLAIVKGCATTLLGTSMHWDTTMQREMLEMIDTQTDHLHELLNTLLDAWQCGAEMPCALAAAPSIPVTASAASLVSLPEHIPNISPLLSSYPLKQSQYAQVIIAERDARLARYLSANLEEQHYRVQVVSHGSQLLHQFELEEPSIVILATSLTDMHGSVLLARLREFSQVPVMILRDGKASDEEECVRLFDLGADDILVKPFSIKEVLARVRALLRRGTMLSGQMKQQTAFTTGDLTIDYAQHQVLVGGQPTQLSRTEYKLLSTLAQHAGMVMTHELLLERVWGPEYNRDIDFIWVYISRLRRKIEADPRHPHYILTVPDVGYKLLKEPMVPVYSGVR